MNSPPTSLVVKMNDEEVQENLTSIIESMDRIREESITCLGANDEQKMDYLRLTGELAGCLKPFIEKNNLQEHTKVVADLVDNDVLLRCYDPLQKSFWDEKQPLLQNSLEDASAVLLRDDFTGENQIYHVFQALKYLNAGNDFEEVYDTILPVNSLLNNTGLKSSVVGSFLIKKLLGDIVSDGVGVKANIEMLSFVQSLEQAGAFYVDLPKEHYKLMKKSFPKTIIVEEEKQKFVRVIFGSPEFVQGINIFEQLKKYAQLELGNSAEDSLVKCMKNFYGFGKKFSQFMKEKIGVQKKDNDSLENKVNDVIIDVGPEDNGNKRNQNEWFKYWSKIDDGRVMASMGDLYLVFKQLKIDVENDDENAKSLLISLRNDFDWPGQKNWLISSTKLQYDPSNTNVKIIHHYDCSDKSLIKEKTVPVYRDTPIIQVVNDEQGIEYLQAYFDTDDDGETIIETLEFIGNKNRSDIRVWTATQESKISNPTRASGLNYSSSQFRVNGSNIVSAGRSRGVLINPRSGRARK